jgi:peptide/nickel transport system permease protein
VAVASGTARSTTEAVARDRGYWGKAAHTLVRDWTAMLGLAIVLVLCLCAVFAPLLAPYDPAFQHREGLTLDGRPLGPGSSGFLLGTDPLGRDELSRLLYGARASLLVGVGGTVLAALVGTAIGCAAGMSRGLAQIGLMRSADVVLSFPVLLLAMALLAVTQPSLATIMLIFAVAYGAYLARIVFTQVVSLREREFILAAQTAGVRTGPIVVRHIVPHVLPSVIVYTTLGVATAILFEAALSYVGIGIQPPESSWGNMIDGGQNYLISAPWLIAFPGGALVLAMVGFSLLGDGLRDALDPTLERVGRATGVR